MLGLCCCTRAFSSCGNWGLLFVAVRGLLIAEASLCFGAWALGAWASVVVACGLSSCGSQALERRLSSCGMWASLLHGMWHLPGPGLEPVSPALAGGFLTTAPPGKPLSQISETTWLPWSLFQGYQETQWTTSLFFTSVLRYFLHIWLFLKYWPSNEVKEKMISYDSIRQF